MSNTIIISDKDVVLEFLIANYNFSNGGTVL